MKNVKIRIFALLGLVFLCFPSQANYYYQNFEDNNGYSDFGWSWNATVGRSVPGEPTRGSPHSWKMQSTVSLGGTGIPSAVNTWNVDFLFGGNDRLTFWIYSLPDPGGNHTALVKFYDQGNYHSQGFEVWTTQTATYGQWTPLTVLFSQLPANFDLHHVDKIEVMMYWPGTYYFDDFQLMREDRVYQSFEPDLRSGSNVSEYGWKWNDGDSAGFSSSPEPVLEGQHSWKLVANQKFSGTGIQCEYQTLSGGNQSFWNTNANPDQNDRFTFWVYALPFTGFDSTLQVQFYDHGAHNNDSTKVTVWTTEAAKIGQWSKLSVPFSKLPSDFNPRDIDKIQFFVWWPGTYYFDRLAFEGRVPDLRLERGPSGDKLIWNALPEAPAAEIRIPNHYEVQASTDGANWQSIFDGSGTELTLNRMNPVFFRIRSGHELGYNANSFPWFSSWSVPLEYAPLQAFIDQKNLSDTGTLSWNAVPGAVSYTVQEASVPTGSWNAFYEGAYPPAPLPASVGHRYRVRSVNANGEISAWSASQRKLSLPDQEFLHASGLQIQDGSGQAFQFRGVNLGAEFLTEEFLTELGNHDQPALEDDWTLRQELKSRFGEAGKNQLMDLWQNTWCANEDLDQLWRLGVNVVRLPVFYLNLQDELGNWILGPGGEINFSAIDRIVRACGNRGIRVLLDLHGAPGSQSTEYHTGRKNFNKLFENSAAGQSYRNQTMALWTEIARHYKNDPNVLGYDLLNEPTGATPAQLHAFYDQLYQGIRAVDPKHLLMMEGIFDWSTLPNPATFHWQNVAYQFHLYKWNENENVQAHKDFVDDFVAESQTLQTQYQIPVMIGEFQCFDLKETWDYYLQKFNEQGWAWTLWNFKIRSPHSTWGLFTLNRDEDAFPVVRTGGDSLAGLQTKLSHYDTFTHGSRNEALSGLVKKYLKANPLPPGAPEPGLVVRYSFDTVENGIVPDESGNHNDAQVVGSPVSSEGQFGSGMEFQPGSYLRAATNPSAGWNQITVSLWFKTNDPSNNYKLASAAWWHGTQDGSGWNMGTHYSELWSDGSPDSIRTEPSWPRSHPLLAGEWNHLVMTYDGSRVREYVNGTLSVNVTGSGLPFGSGMPLEVGAWSSIGFTNYQGLLDEFRLYDRALSDEEIASLYQTGSLPQARPANQPPMAVISGATVWELQSPGGAPVHLSASSSSDPDSANPLAGYLWSGSFGTRQSSDLSVTLPLGTNPVTLRVFDGTDWSPDVSVNVTVRDSTAPQVAIASPLGKAYKVSDPATTVEFSATDKSGVPQMQATLNGASVSLHQAVKWVNYLSLAQNTLRVQARDGSGNQGFSEIRFSVQNTPQILKDWLTASVKSKKLTQTLATQMQNLLTQYSQQKTAAQKALVLKALLLVWDVNKSKIETAFYSDFRKALTYLS